MEQTTYKGIPYPSEYEEPFFDSFESMMEYLDVHPEMGYQPIDGATPDSDTEFSFPITIANDTRLAVGLPIRFREAEYDLWRYGIITSVGASSGVIEGAAITGDDTLFEVGSPSMVTTMHFHHPGIYNPSADQDGLMWEQIGKSVQWMGGRAFLVRMLVNNKTDNGPGNEKVNVQKGFGGEPGSAYWFNVYDDNSGDGVSVNQGWNIGQSVNEIHYGFNQGELIDFFTPGGSPNSAEDLNVTLVFVNEGFQDQLCTATSSIAPQLSLTISGMPEGSDWQGLTDGVHLICPSGYVNQWDYEPYGGNTTLKEQLVLQKAGYTSDIMQMKAEKIDWGTGSSLTSIIQFIFDGSMTYLRYTKDIYGYFRNRLFTTFVVNGVTFTFARGPGPWGGDDYVPV